MQQGLENLNGFLNFVDAAENYVKDTKLDNNMGLFFKSITDWKEAAKYATIAGVTINNKTK